MYILVRERVHRRIALLPRRNFTECNADELTKHYQCGVSSFTNSQHKKVRRLYIFVASTCQLPVELNIVAINGLVYPPVIGGVEPIAPNFLKGAKLN